MTVEEQLAAAAFRVQMARWRGSKPDPREDEYLDEQASIAAAETDGNMVERDREEFKERWIALNQKPLWHYIAGTITVLDHTAYLESTDHACTRASLSETFEIQTSKPLHYDKATGRLETKNSVYWPVDVSGSSGPILGCSTCGKGPCPQFNRCHALGSERANRGRLGGM